MTVLQYDSRTSELGNGNFRKMKWKIAEMCLAKLEARLGVKPAFWFRIKKSQIIGKRSTYAKEWPTHPYLTHKTKKYVEYFRSNL